MRKFSFELLKLAKLIRKFAYLLTVKNPKDLRIGVKLQFSSELVPDFPNNRLWEQKSLKLESFYYPEIRVDGVFLTESAIRRILDSYGRILQREIRGLSSAIINELKYLLQDELTRIESPEDLAQLVQRVDDEQARTLPLEIQAKVMQINKELYNIFLVVSDEQKKLYAMPYFWFKVLQEDLEAPSAKKEFEALFTPKKEEVVEETGEIKPATPGRFIERAPLKKLKKKV